MKMRAKSTTRISCTISYVISCFNYTVVILIGNTTLVMGLLDIFETHELHKRRSLDPQSADLSHNDIWRSACVELE